MECPRCRKNTLSSDGICRACNYQIEMKETDNMPQNAGEDTSTNSPLISPKEELPSWQKELAQRLSNIMQTKETDENSGQMQSQSEPTTLAANLANASGQSPRVPAEHAGTIQVRSHTLKPQPSEEKAGRLAPKQKTIASLGPNVLTPKKAADKNDSKDVADLIDSTVYKHSVKSVEKPPVVSQESYTAEENKLILLSRTLAGLIDLIIVVLCTAIFIISADYFSGIVILDAVSIVEYSGLFLLVFFLYSIFFLATSGQTIGMMITDLRIIGIHGSRPSIGQLFSRCFGYLLSVLVFGTGLLWSLFDRNSMCFHDRFSNTSIIRL